MRTPELLALFRSTCGLPPEVSSRLDSIDSWLVFPPPEKLPSQSQSGVDYASGQFPRVCSRVCPACYPRPVPKPLPDVVVVRPQVRIVDLVRYEIHNHAWQTPFLFWFGVCRSCDRVLIAYVY